MGERRGWTQGTLAGLAGNKLFLLMLGGAIGTHVRQCVASNVFTPGPAILGGAIGTCLRYFVGRWFNRQPWGQAFPVGTLFINVTGSLLLAGLAILLLEGSFMHHEGWYLLLGTGFCGGYTTFSTFQWETFRLARDGSWRYAVANVVASVSFGFLIVLLGVVLASLFATPVTLRPQAFPFGTLAVNVAGSFILAAAALILLERLPPRFQNWHLFIGTGFCGGMTTFSTLEWEAFKLAQGGRWWLALGDLLGSVFAGFLAVLLAVFLVGLVFPKGRG